MEDRTGLGDSHQLIQIKYSAQICVGMDVDKQPVDCGVSEAATKTVRQIGAVDACPLKDCLKAATAYTIVEDNFVPHHMLEYWNTDTVNKLGDCDVAPSLLIKSGCLSNCLPATMRLARSPLPPLLSPQSVYQEHGEEQKLPPLDETSHPFNPGINSPEAQQTASTPAKN